MLRDSLNGVRSAEGIKMNRNDVLDFAKKLHVADRIDLATDILGFERNLHAVDELKKENSDYYNLIWDIAQIADSAISGGHHDLIQRIKQIVKNRESK